MFWVFKIDVKRRSIQIQLIIVLGPHVLRQNQLICLIFLDSAPCHQTASSTI
jgi:hypothetical protein